MILRLSHILKRAATELKDSGIKSADLDARVLLEAAIDKDSAYIFAHPEAPMTNAVYSKFRRYIRKRKKGEPVAHILGHKEFFDLDFIVNKNVLIPRPETEWLVEKALELISSQILSIKDQKLDSSGTLPHTANPVIRILDIGTGSGCIIISIVKGFRKFHSHFRSETDSVFSGKILYYATDISRRALAVAKKNAAQHSAKDEISFFHSDLFSNSKLPKKFDLVLANLPYVPHKAANDSVKFEPKEAIFASGNGTAIIRQFLNQAVDKVNQHGLILIELDPRNANSLHSCAKKKFPKANIELKQDLAGLSRYLKIAL